ncbi:MAG TPA: AAA family ATPase, partial [Phycisphaerales bacterium]|nr:AAA family ATPase [Phycisphaerales bacterium]
MAKRAATTKEPRAPREQEVPVPPLPPVQAPVGLSQVLGQEKAASLLRDAVSAGRVHHAWIFQGPQGVGKFTLALAFAALILDETTSVGLTGELAPDPDSRVQQLLRSGTHPDLAVINKELAAYHPEPEVRKRKQTTIPIDVLRHFMLEPGALSPTVPGNSLAGRVFIIDEAEYLNNNSQNAILKLLEEPPQRTVMMLVCNSPEMLLPTIRSRCQRVTCMPLSQQAMHTWSKQAMKDGTLNVEPSQQQWLLDFAQGSPGAVMRCAQTGVYTWWLRIEPMLKLVAAGKH